MSLSFRKSPYGVSRDIIACAFIITVCVFGNSLWLANLRRPSHDTLLGFVPLRMWASGLIHSGDWPLWNFSGRYGFPFSNLYFASGVLSPSGLLFGWLFQYDTRVFQLESTIWQCIGGLGAYLLARNYLCHRLTACVVSISFISSAVVTIGGYAGTVQIGYMGIPWVFLGLTLSARATSPKQSALAIGVLVTSTFWIITSGYPQTWLVLPVFCLPFIITLSSTTKLNMIYTLVRCVFSLLLLISCIIPIVVDTMFTPLFGIEVRNSINSDDGATPLTAVFGLFLVNPTWLPGISHLTPPVYAGLITGLTFSWHVSNLINNGIVKCFSVTVNIFRKLFVFLRDLPFVGRLCHTPSNFNWSVTRNVFVNIIRVTLFVLLAVSSSPTLAEDNSIRNVFKVNNIIEIIPIKYLSGLILVFFMFVYRPVGFVPLRRPDIAFLLTIILVLVSATENPIGAAIRLYVPPFKWLRWSYYELAFMLLSLLLFSWQFIENIVFLDTGKNRAEYWKIFILYSKYIIIIISCMYLFTYSGLIKNEHYSSRIGFVSVIFSVVILSSYCIILWCNLRNEYYILLTLFINICLVVTYYYFSEQDDVVRSYINLYGIGTSMIDIFHASLIIISLYFNSQYNNKKTFLAGLAVISIIDITSAKPRYLADLDIIIGWQAPHDIGEIPRFDYSGDGRDLTVSTTNNAIRSGRPGVEPWGPAMPQVRDFEDKFGSPALFDQFVHFPSAWTIPSSGSAFFTPESVGRPANPDLTPPSGPIASPDCKESDTPTSPQPSAMVTRLLSSYVQVNYDTACTRLFAYTDTWALGWTATIDGIPTPVLQLNGAIRGVIAPAGSHVLEWTYRPAYWAITRWISLTGLLSTLVCLVWGLWPVRLRPRLPAP